MEIQPASLDQVMLASNGKRINITSDVGDVVKDLKAIDSNYEVHAVEYFDNGQLSAYFEIRCFNPTHGKSYLVTTATELDQRIVNRIKEIRDPSYNYADELEKAEQENKDKLEVERKEQIGDIGERLAHAMRKDKGIKKNF